MPYRKDLNIVLQHGLINISATVGINGATEAEQSLTSVCTGSGGAPAHAPTPLKQQMTCKHCGVIAYTDIQKAKVSGDQYIVVDKEEVAAAHEQVVGTSKKLLSLTVHDAEEVFTATLPGKSLYYVEPQGAGQLAGYGLLYDVVSRHPEKAFLTEFTPTSRVGLYQVRAFGGVLVLQSLYWPEEVKAAPVTQAIEPDAGLQGQLDGLLEVMQQPFAPEQYRNDYAEALASLLASKEAVTGEVAPSSPRSKTAATTVGAVDLSAQLAALLGASAAKPARKPRARKAS